MFSLWALLMPFWVIAGHTILATIVFISLIQLFSGNMMSDMRSMLKRYWSAFALFGWIVISSFISSESKQATDAMLDMSYLILVPVAFLNINSKERRLIYSIFEFAVWAFMLLLLAYSAERFFKIDTDYSFIRFMELNLEQFWHTSYLSALILLVFIKNIKRDLLKNPQLVLLYLLSLGFMYFINARLPFIAGGLLLGYQLYRMLKPNLLKHVFGFVVLILSGFLIFFFLFRNQSNQIDSQNLGDINSRDARVSIWKASLSGIKKNPVFGVGNKNTRDVIYQNLEDSNSTKFRNYNCHNQFLEFALSHGLLALVLFLVMLFKLFQNTPVYAKCLGVIFILLFMVESYMQVQSGIVFFCFWYFFMLKYNPEDDE